MKRAFLFLVCAIPALSIAIAQKPAGSTPPTADGGVRQAVMAYGQALQSGDLNAILNFWTADADYLDETGKTYKGRDALANLYKPSLADMKKGKVSISVSSMRLLRPDIAIVDGQVDFTPPDGAIERNRFSAIWTQTGGKWQMASARDLPDLDTDVADANQKSFSWLVGDWKAERDGTSINLSCKPVLNNKFTRMEFTVKRSNDEFAVWQIVGWDPSEGAIRSWIFDSHGGHGSGQWARDSEGWVGEMTGVLANGKSATSRTLIKPAGPNAFIWRSTDREVDGQPIADHELKYTRVTAGR